MATFLTTAKMNPALAARVESSVTGRRVEAGARNRRIVSLVRLVILLTVAAAIYNVVTGRRQARRELERTRASLLDTVRAHGASLTTEERAAVARVEAVVIRAAGAYEGDVVADELRAPGGLPALLRQQIVYVRGTPDALETSAGITAAAAVSSKDALVLCLVEPPPARTELALLEKVRMVHARGPQMEDRTANIRRLHEPIAGLPFLLPRSPWSERVSAAEDIADLTKLKTELDRAPIERAKQAARARLLLVAIDEPGDGKGPTELDGERAHAVRVALVDLASSKVLLRLRRPVDPSWISPSRRATYASGLDSCALAFDIHEGLRSDDQRKP